MTVFVTHTCTWALEHSYSINVMTKHGDHENKVSQSKESCQD